MRLTAALWLAGVMAVSGCGSSAIGPSGADGAVGDAAASDGVASGDVHPRDHRDAAPGPAGDGGPADGGIPADAGPGTGPADGGQHVDGTFSADGDQRSYRVFVPAGYQAGNPVPLVVLLPGCGQTAQDAEATSGYSSLAEQKTFIVVYPEQDALANPTLCWNWFNPSNQARDQGEPALIAGITRRIIGSYDVDTSRVYVIGASAGGAMSVIMGATYPDLYAAIGVVAGCEYGGAPCGMLPSPDPVTQGTLAYQAMGAHARVVPVQIFYGDADPLISTDNAELVVQQWVATDDLADDGQANGSLPAMPTQTRSGQVPGGHAYDVASYSTSAGRTVVERWRIQGGGHAWPGGPAQATFTDPAGPDATGLSYQFFLANPAR
jgi:poly(hydroxyalkanoate) depolymerase family esterase